MNEGREVICYTGMCHSEVQQVGTLLQIFTDADSNPVFLIEGGDGEVFTHYAESCKFADKVIPAQTSMITDEVLHQCLDLIRGCRAFTMGQLRDAVSLQQKSVAMRQGNAIILGHINEPEYNFCFSPHWPNDKDEAIARLKMVNMGALPESWNYNSRYHDE